MKRILWILGIALLGSFFAMPGWSQTTWNVSYVASPVAGGVVSGPATIDVGATAALSVIANAGYVYTSMAATNGLVSGAIPSPNISNVTANTTVTATFTAKTNAITFAASPVAGGTVTGPATIVTGNTGIVVATQTPGYTYASIAATAGATVTGAYPNFTLSGVTAATTVTATFTANTNSISYVTNPVLGGTLTGPATIVTGAAPGSLTVTTNAGYTYASIAATAGATITGAYPNFTLNRVTDATTVSVMFMANMNIITYVATPLLEGTVTGPATIITGNTGVFTATASAGYTCASIAATAGATITGTYPVFMLNGVTAATTVTATFSANINNITYVASPVAGGTLTGPATIVTGNTGVFTAAASAGYAYTSITATAGATITGTYPNFTLNGVTAATTVTATFTANANNITYVASPAVGGTLTGSTMIVTGDAGAMAVMQAPGYTYASIDATAGADITGAYPNFMLNGVTAATTVTATFTANTSNITYIASPAVGGTLTGAPTIQTGGTATITVTANAGYAIGTLTASKGSITASPPYVLSGVTMDTAVTATFAPQITPQIFTVPEVVGLTQTVASGTIADASLAVGTITEQYSATILAGTVIAQSPTSGVIVIPSAKVDLTVSKGPEIVEGEGEPNTPPTAEEVRTQISTNLNAVDANGDGQISYTESLTAVPGLTLDVFNQIDTDRDGLLSQTELGLPDNSGGCGCGCNKSESTLDGIKKHLGDLFLLAMSMMMLPLLSRVTR